MQINANAESFQAQYERLVENWLTNFAQINQAVLNNLELSVVNSKGEKQTLYGKNESGEKICDISPEQIQQIESGELKPDIKVNQSLEETEQRGEERVRVSPEEAKVSIREQQSQRLVDDYYEDYDSFDFEEAQENVLIDLVSDLVDSLPDPIQAESEPERDIQDELDDFFQVDETYSIEQDVSEFDLNVITEPSEVQIDPNQNQDISSTQEQEQLPQKTGLDCMEEAVCQLKDGSLKTVLNQSIQELRVEISEQQPNSQLDQLMEARTQAAQDPNWWQRTTSKIEEMVTQVRDTFVGGRAASTLKQFADKLDLQSGDSYEGAEYNLKREGRDYTLTDKQGQDLLKFKSTVLGVNVDNRLPGLDDRDSKKIEALRQDLQRGNQPQGAFVSEGKAEADYLRRVSSITSTLSRYAAQNGGTAKVEGRFSYDWESSKSGSVMIKNKQGEVLLAAGQGLMRSRMSEKDLNHFEEMIPNLGVQQQGQTAGHKKKQIEVG